METGFIFITSRHVPVEETPKPLSQNPRRVAGQQ